MTKLSDQQIEHELTQQHATLVAAFIVAKTERECDVILTAALRATYTLGRDQGTAETIERALGMIESSVANLKAVQALTSLEALEAWVLAGGDISQRSWTYRRGRVYDAADVTLDSVVSRVFLWDMSRDMHFDGADQAEAIARAATWCRDHMARDTEPAPAPATVPSNPAPVFEIAPALLSYLEPGE